MVLTMPSSEGYLERKLKTKDIFGEGKKKFWVGFKSPGRVTSEIQLSQESERID